MSEQTQSGFTLKGWHVLAGFVAFFAVGIAVNIVFVTQAITTFRGEDVERSYMQGLAYNDVLAAREVQAERGWQAAVDVQDNTVSVTIRDASNQPVSGLSFMATLKHPVDLNRDRVLEFSSQGDGIYVAPLADLPAGRWTLSLRSVDEPPFEMEYELWQRSP